MLAREGRNLLRPKRLRPPLPLRDTEAEEAPAPLPSKVLLARIEMSKPVAEGLSGGVWITGLPDALMTAHPLRHNPSSRRKGMIASKYPSAGTVSANFPS